MVGSQLQTKIQLQSPMLWNDVPNPYLFHQASLNTQDPPFGTAAASLKTALVGRPRPS